jgi:hypothetical protein
MSTIQEKVFTQDWSHCRNYWPDMFLDYGLVGKPDLHFLEIGCFEGMTTLWLLDNVLTDPSSHITVVDTFYGSPEFDRLNVDRDFRHRFCDNIREYINRVNIVVGPSAIMLPSLPINEFDFIYVDGSHTADDVYCDATYSWPKLKQGGLMVFDDYAWGAGLPDSERPGPAIDYFVNEHSDELEVRHIHYQYVVEKVSP